MVWVKVRVRVRVRVRARLRVRPHEPQLRPSAQPRLMMNDLHVVSFQLGSECEMRLHNQQGLRARSPELGQTTGLMTVVSRTGAHGTGAAGEIHLQPMVLWF